MNRIRNNFLSYKGRQAPTKEQKVKVYKNLHNGLWSIKDYKSGLVLGHAESITLVTCEFKVSQKGRERVLKEKQKNVHAYVVGHFFSFKEERSDVLTHVTYNPYKDKHFTTHASNRKDIVSESDVCFMIASDSYIGAIGLNLK